MTQHARSAGLGGKQLVNLLLLGMGRARREDGSLGGKTRRALFEAFLLPGMTVPQVQRRVASASAFVLLRDLLSSCPQHAIWLFLASQDSPLVQSRDSQGRPRRRSHSQD